MDSEQECTHRINRNQILQEAVCNEKHNFRPFRNEKGSGILSSVEQKLQFDSEGGSVVSAAVGHRKSLSFDHSEFEFQESTEGASLARENIRKLCQTSSSDVRPETPGLFTELVYNLRKLQFNELKQINLDVAKNGICSQDRKFFYDAVPVCGTEACVKLTVDILKSRTLNEQESKAWVSALSLIPKPTLVMVEQVSELADRLEPQALLGISSLIHGYCRENPNCWQLSEVSQFVSKLTTKLGDKCTSVRDHTTKAVLLLKAIGNVGHVQSAIPALISCFRESRNPEEIRLAAVQALRRMPCEQQKQPLLEQFRDTAEDIEIRIFSFLTLMKCPTSDLITQVKDILDHESVTQVGAFVYTYLKEKSKTSDPFQQELYNLLRHQRLSSKFNRDPRKFSRFYEIGQFIDSTNVGGHAEVGLIMEPEGYLPRQGFLNLTMHLFGTSINLFEIGGRTEGLERLADKLFGPDGYFTNPSGYYFNQNEAKPHSNARVKTLQDLYSGRKSFSEHFSMSTYLRLFGDDLAYYDFKNGNMVDEIRNMMNTEKLMEVLAKEQSVEVSRNILFLDSTLTVPTISGIPLRLAVNGTASVHVKYGGKMDFTQLMRAPHNIDIVGEIKPSAAIELSSTVALDVRSVKTGVKMIGRMHTSTAAKGLLQFRSGEFKTSLELPDDKMEVIDIQTQLFHVVKNTHIEEPGVLAEKTQSESCTCDKFGRVTGLKICSSMSLPRRKLQSNVPYFPLTGPMRATINIEKSDPTLRSYEMTTKMVNTPNENEFEFKFNTPGSTIDREIIAKVQHKPGQSMMAELKTPAKQLKLDGTMTRDRDIQQGRLSLLVDNTKTYTVAAKLKKTLQRGSAIHNFEAEVDMPDKEDVKVTGLLKRQSNRFETSFNIEGLNSEPIEGKLLWDQPETGYRKFNSELMMKCPAIHLDVKASGKAEVNGNIDYKYTIDYKRPRIDTTPHKIVASQVQTITKEGSTLKIQSTSSFSSSWYPKWNGETVYRMTKGDEIFENRLNIKYGAQKKTADFAQATRITEGDKYTTELSADVPEARLKQEMKLTYQNRFPSSFTGRVEWPTFKNFVGELNLANSNDNLWLLEAEAKAEYTGRKVRLFKKIEEKTPQNYKSKAILQWQTGEQVEVDSDIILKSRRGVYEYEINSVAKMSGSSESITFRKTFKMTGDEAKYIALAKKGDKSFYDFKLDMIKESNTKTNFQTQLKSNWMNNLDYDVSGTVESESKSTRVVATVKKDMKDWMKGEFVVPKQIRQSSDVQVKGHLFWDLHTSDTKELMGDYNLIKDGSSRTHQLKVQIKAGRADYLWDAKVTKAEYYMMNSTLLKNQQPLIESHWGAKVQGINYIDPRDLAVDFKIRTYNPMTPQHLQGLLTHTHGPRMFKTNGYIQCHQSNRKAAFDLEGKHENVGKDGRKYSGKALFQLNSKEFTLEQETTVPKRSEPLVISGKTTSKLSWSSDKEVVFKQEYQTGSNSFLKADLTTPFNQLSEAKAEIRLENPRSTPKFSTEFNWNKSKRIFGQISGTVSEPNSLDLNLDLESSFEALQKLEGKMKYNFRNEWDVETWIKWNEDARIKFLHKRKVHNGKYTADLDLECVIPNQANVIGKMNVEHHQAQNTYKADGQLTLGEEEYKANTNLNLNDNTGDLKLLTPYEALNSARISVSKTGNNEYKVETEKNGEATGSVTAMIKLHEGDHELRIEADEIRYPFNAIYQGQYSNKKWHVKTEINVDPNKGTKRTYGLQLTDERQAAGLIVSHLVLKHPMRQMSLKVKRDTTNTGAYRFITEIQPNMGSSRKPTKLMYICHHEGVKSSQEFKLVDPSIPKGIKLTYNKEKDGQCSDFTTRCKSIVELKLDYSGETDKVLTLKSHVELEPAENRLGNYNMKAEFHLTHPATDLHNKVYFRTPGDRTWEAGIEYKNAQRIIKAYSTSVEYSQDRSTVTLNFITPEDQWAVRYTRKARNNIVLTLMRNGEATYDAGVTINPTKRLAQIEIKKSKSSEVLFHSSAQLASGDLARIRVWHSEQGKRIDDAEFNVKLDRADLLRTKFYVRPGFSRELQHVASQKIDQIKADQQKSNNLKELTRGVSKTIISTGSDLGNDINDHIEPFRNYLSQEKNQLAEQMGPAMSEISSQIEVYLEMSREFFLAFLDVAEMSIEQLIDTVPGDSFKDYYRAMKQTVSHIPENLSRMSEPMVEVWQQIAAIISDITGKMADARNKISENLNLREAREKLQSTWTDIQNSDLMKQMKQMYDRLVLSVTGLSPNEVYSRYYSKVEQEYSQAKSQVSDMWSEYRDWFLEYQIGQYLADWIQEIGSKIRSTYNYVDAEDNFENVVEWLKQLLKSYIPTTREGWNRYMPQVKVNDPETGKYELEIPLPVKAKSLEHLLSQAHPDNFVSIKDKLQRTWAAYTDEQEDAQQEITEPGYSVWDTVYHYKPASWKPMKWMPPYDSNAFLIGGHHFVTFDGHVFDFAADCEYLLARDFHDKKFTISAEFTTGSNGVGNLKNLKVHTNGHHVELENNGKVKVDGRQSELPWQKMDSMDGQVLVQVEAKNNKIVLKTQDGVKIKCTKQFKMCIITLSGRYHGKSAGLLGSNDNEPVNDMMNFDKVRYSNVKDFAASWHVGGGSCASMENKAPTVRVQANSPGHDACKRMFRNNNSPLRAGFSQVKPGPYMAMCTVDMQTFGGEAWCNISAAYIAAAWKVGIRLELPKECYHCSVPGSAGDLSEGDSKEIRGSNLKTADVIFAVEERNCMKWSQAKLPEIGRLVEGELTKKDIRNVRFGLTGFSGEGVHYRPHFHTGSGQLSFDVSGLQSAAQQLAFDKITMADTEPVDPMESMEFLTDNYPWRPASEKIVILLTCTECGASKKVGYYNLQNKLLEAGIRFHMITDQYVQVEDEENDAENFIGLDAHTLFGSSGNSDNDLRGSLVNPHDSCTILAQETNGTVFSSGGDKNTMATRMSQEIGRKFITSTCQLCECQGEKLNPTTVCYPCDIPQPVSLGGSGDKFFNIPYLKLKKTYNNARYAISKIGHI